MDRHLGPRAYLEEKPTSQSIKLGGRFINLAALSRAEGFDHSYLSRICSGERTPTISYASQIAKALKMGLEEFLAAIDERKAERREKMARMLGQVS